jgi:outer membrane protein OmpU
LHQNTLKIGNFGDLAVYTVCLLLIITIKNKGVINMNIKKIGMTALAASLVSVSANAAELTASGGASINGTLYSGKDVNYGKSFSMGNNVTFTGSGETENGLTVSLSFELDQSKGANSGPFDSHSVTVASDALGTLKFSGHGGSSAASAIDTTAAGDIWDAFDNTNWGPDLVLDTANLAKDGSVKDSAPGNNSMYYTAPELMDGLAINLSYTPHATSSGTTGGKSSMGYGFGYTGIDGLSVSYGLTDIENETAGDKGEQTVIDLEYAYGPVTVGYSVSEYDVGTAANDQDTTSYAISYTVSENLSVSYGYEEIEGGSSGDIDAEYTKLSASYTTGGVTLSAAAAQAENIDHTANAEADLDMYTVGASFAF